MMKSASKSSLLDYFHSTKKFSSAGKRNLEAFKLGKEAISKLSDEQAVSRPNQNKEIDLVRENSDVLVNLKRPKSVSDDNNNDSPIQAAKRLCVTKQSSLLVPVHTVNIAVNNTVKPVQQVKPQSRLNRLNQIVANASLTLKQTQNNISQIPKSKDLPAYQRFSSLAEDDSSAEFILPYKYKLLLKTFESFEQIVSMLYNGKQLCFIDKIFPSVKKLTQRPFTNSDLGKLVTVYPKAYILKLESVPVNSYYNKKTGGLQLTVNPDLSNVEEANKINGFIPMAPKIMLKRKSIFRKKLIEITKIHHEKYLTSLKTPITVNESQIRRWHSDFKVDAVPDIEPADIPEPNQDNKISRAEDVLKKIGGLYSKRIDNAFETVIASTAANTNQSATNPKHQIKSSLKGIPQGLLEKVRAREAAKALSIMTRDPETEKKQKMISRLPELARILKTLFVQDQQTSLIAPYVFDKISDSYIGSFTDEEIENHLKLLSNLVPEWLSIVNLRDGAMYYKLQREIDFNNILKKIAATKV